MKIHLIATVSNTQLKLRSPTGPLSQHCLPYGASSGNSYCLGIAGSTELCVVMDPAEGRAVGTCSVGWNVDQDHLWPVILFVSEHEG